MTIERQSCTAIEHDVVPYDGVSYGINPFKCVPNHITFNDVHRIRARAVDEDARICPVVDDIVANDVGMRPDLHLNSVSLTRSGKTVMNPVLLDQRILHDARGVIAADIHTFARSAIDTRVVNVITT